MGVGVDRLEKHVLGLHFLSELLNIVPFRVLLHWNTESGNIFNLNLVISNRELLIMYACMQ